MVQLTDDLHAKLAQWTANRHRERDEAVWAMLLPLLKEHFELVYDHTGTPVALRCKPAEENAALRAALRALVEHETDPCDLDRHGYCQTHSLQIPCSVAAARALLGLETARC